MILSGLHSFRNLDLKNQLNDINFIGRWNAGAFDYVYNFHKMQVF